MVQASVPESLEDLKDAYDAEIDQLMEDLYGEPNEMEQTPDFLRQQSLLESK